MILRVTAKLGKKIKNIPEAALPLDANPFADWSANLFTAERRQYILVVNTPSLFTVVIPGRGVTSVQTFLRRMRIALREFMPIEGHEHAYRTLIEPAMDTVSVSMALNRSVTGSINDLIFGAKIFMAGNELSLVEVSNLLNETPLSYLDSNPRVTFRSLVENHINLDERGDTDTPFTQPRQLPRNLLEWIEEIREAYVDAREAIPFGRLVNHTFGEDELYHLAPSVAVKFRGLRSDEHKLKQATEAALSSYVANFEVEKEALSDPLLAFAFCYLASHYGLDLVGIATLEKVMDLVEKRREYIDTSGNSPEQPGITWPLEDCI